MLELERNPGLLQDVRFLKNPKYARYMVAPGFLLADERAARVEQGFAPRTSVTVPVAAVQQGYMSYTGARWWCFVPLLPCCCAHTRGYLALLSAEHCRGRSGQQHSCMWAGSSRARMFPSSQRNAGAALTRSPRPSSSPSPSCCLLPAGFSFPILPLELALPILEACVMGTSLSAARDAVLEVARRLSAEEEEEEDEELDG